MIRRLADPEVLLRAAEIAVGRANDHRRAAEIAFKAGRGRDGREALDAADEALAEAEDQRRRYRIAALGVAGSC